MRCLARQYVFVCSCPAEVCSLNKLGRATFNEDLLCKNRIEGLFKSDYRQVRSKLLIKGVEYDEAISVLDAIIESGAFRKQ